MFYRQKGARSPLLFIRSLRTSRPPRILLTIALLVVIVGGSFAVYYTTIGAPTVAQQDNTATETLKIALAVSLTGATGSYGLPTRDGARLAVEEANATGDGPPIELAVYDDASDNAKGQEVARQIIASDALAVVGPATTQISLAAGPLYAEAGLVSIGTTATGDGVTANRTTFRASFSTSDGGEVLGNYLGHVLNSSKAAVLFREDGYGLPFTAGFKRAAERLGSAADYYPFKTPEEAEQIAKQVANDPDHPAIVLGVLVADVEPLLKTFRRENAQAPILGTNAIAGEFFTESFRQQPEEQQKPGYFTDGVYAVSPMIFDSTNAETLAFEQRFLARFGYEPSYFSPQGYEAARLAIAAVRAAAQAGAITDLGAGRTAVYNYLISLDSPMRGIAGLHGPLWFTPDRGRVQDLRMGRFSGALFESAPVQIVSVAAYDQSELTSGAVFELGSNRYARLQRVVYTGIFLNEIPRIDLTRSSFDADFYLWLRFAQDAGVGSADPTDLLFPNMVSGAFNQGEPMKKRVMEDGTEYWLWRVQGEFRNDFDLRRFPFDQQALSLSFFNARAATDQIVYVVDKRVRSGVSGGPLAEAESSEAVVAQAAAQAALQEAAGGTRSFSAPGAFRNLSEWDALGGASRRENLVTESTLGDPVNSVLNSRLELSGFLATVDVQRRALTTLSKTLLPLLIMTLIMFASLYFPATLVKEKVIVAVMLALVGAVLLTSINTQLGATGYTLSIEYVFYVFFALTLLCIISILGAERLRVVGHTIAATHVDLAARITFVLALIATVVTTVEFLWR